MDKKIISLTTLHKNPESIGGLFSGLLAYC
jgi:hypothetical protein